MLKTVKLRKTLFIKLLDTFDIYAERTNNINQYKRGYQNKNHIYYNDHTLICTESHLQYIDALDTNEVDGLYNDWMQLIVECDNETTSNKIKAGITGSVAKAMVTKQLLKKYKRDELQDILTSYDAKYADNTLKQYHYLPFDCNTDNKSILVFDNCYGYDINGAHNNALCEMFPKCDKYFKKLYDERHDKPQNKMYANYFVGCLVPSGFKSAYNYIVHKTTIQLLNAISFTNGQLLYANTDGFITQSPIAKLNTSNNLGDFKLELCGKLYAYRDKNYWCIQYNKIKSDGTIETVLKGNVLNEVRDKINLFNGQVVHYDKTKTKQNIMVATNITTETIEEFKSC